jgi:hypothetical protein
MTEVTGCGCCVLYKGAAYPYCGVVEPVVPKPPKAGVGAAPNAGVPPKPKAEGAGVAPNAPNVPGDGAAAAVGKPPKLEAGAGAPKAVDAAVGAEVDPNDGAVEAPPKLKLPVAGAGDDDAEAPNAKDIDECYDRAALQATTN